MANFRLWVHEQVSRLDNERAHRHIAMGVAVLFLAVVFGAPALDFVFAQTGVDIVSAKDLGEGKARFDAQSELPLLTASFKIVDSVGNSSVLLASGGPNEWSVTTELPKGTYQVIATGID